VTKDGPYRVNGAIPLAGAGGEPVPRAEGSSVEHYALCRCGHSQNKPFCSGMHWYVQFRDPVPVPGHEPTLFEWAGGLGALTRMARLLYEKHVPADPVLAPVFAQMAPDQPHRLAAWLAEALGGPAAHSREHGSDPPMAAPGGQPLTEQPRSRWVSLVGRAADEAGLPGDPGFRSAFSSCIEWASRIAVQAQSGAFLPVEVPRWDWGPPGPPGLPAGEAAGEDAGEPAARPGPDEPVSFAAHIRPLFRDRDRQSMSFAFDLGSYADVSANAQPILDRVRNGSMPCDAAWPQEKVQVFQRWVDSGMAE
jgi:truncated hemoglobin YjbI/CDGSH-type Zn-finger protein